MLKELFGLFFPSYCLTCQQLLEQSERWLCTACWVELPQTFYHTSPADNLLIEKFYGRVPFTYAMAFYRFRAKGYVQQLIHEIKYGNQSALGQEVGRLYGKQLADIVWPHPFEVIVPVPLHPRRLRQRGYNQSLRIAQGIAETLQVPCVSHALQRTKYTRSQTSSTVLERLQQLLDAFQVSDPASLQGRHVLLVDDVVTTGATVEGCAQALFEAGVPSVSLAALAIVE